jgi:hypothetical protein
MRNEQRIYVSGSVYLPVVMCLMIALFPFVFGCITNFYRTIATIESSQISLALVTLFCVFLEGNQLVIRDNMVIFYRIGKVYIFNNENAIPKTILRQMNVMFCLKRGLRRPIQRRRMPFVRNFVVLVLLTWFGCHMFFLGLWRHVSCPTKLNLFFLVAEAFFLFVVIYPSCLTMIARFRRKPH